MQQSEVDALHVAIKLPVATWNRVLEWIQHGPMKDVLPIHNHIIQQAQAAVAEVEKKLQEATSPSPLPVPASTVAPVAPPPGGPAPAPVAPGALPAPLPEKVPS